MQVRSIKSLYIKSKAFLTFLMSNNFYKTDFEGTFILKEKKIKTLQKILSIL